MKKIKIDIDLSFLFWRQVSNTWNACKAVIYIKDFTKRISEANDAR